MVSETNRRVAAIHHNFEQRESRLSRSNIRLLFFNSFHGGAVHVKHHSRGKGCRAETPCHRSTEPLAHGRNELLFPAAAWRRYTSMRATHGNGLADHQAIAASRDHGEECETGQIRGRFLRDIHARRRLLLQHRVRDDDGDGVDRRQSERLDAPAALSIVQQICGCPIQPGK